MQNPLETATLDWRNANTPVSSHFGDVYFSVDDGFAESRYVYLFNNHLTERFASLDKPHFTIAETGFGTGLNFLLAWQAWQQHAPQGKKLYYISTECYPLTRSDLEKSLACWPELAKLSRALCTHYPLPLAGLHCLELDDGVTLMLLLGDAAESLQWLVENTHPLLAPANARAVDAWFLDGFAPDKNPAMWTPELFSTMASLSKRGTTFASFTAAGLVRRGLQATGFTVEKVKGFGKKREMIRGEYRGLPRVEEHINTSSRARAYGPFWPVYRATAPVTSVLVIGAGIAGITTATLLANAGMQVTLVDSHNEPLQGASGNPQAMLFPKFSYEKGAFAEFNLHSYLYAQRFYETYFPHAFHRCGMLQILDNDEWANIEKTLVRFQGMENLVSLQHADSSSVTSNTRIDQPCLWFESSGWIRPATVRESLVNDTRIAFMGNTSITSLEKNGHHWQAKTSEGKILVQDAIVLCNAQAANSLWPELAVPAKTIRGQISIFPAGNRDTLKTIVCHEGYIAPPDPLAPAYYTCGATYDLNSKETGLLQSSQDDNITTLKQHLPGFSSIDTARLPLQGRVEFRCTTNDYLPVIGPVPKTESFIRCYGRYGKNSKAHIPVTGDYHQGLFVNIAHGSRGFSTAPMAAALIRAYLLEQPWPMPFGMATELHPARFLIRDIIRNKIDTTIA